MEPARSGEAARTSESGVRVGRLRIDQLGWEIAATQFVFDGVTIEEAARRAEPSERLGASTEQSESAGSERRASFVGLRELPPPFVGAVAVPDENYSWLVDVHALLEHPGLAVDLSAGGERNEIESVVENLSRIGLAYVPLGAGALTSGFCLRYGFVAEVASQELALVHLRHREAERELTVSTRTIDQNPPPELEEEALEQVAPGRRIAPGLDAERSGRREVAGFPGIEMVLVERSVGGIERVYYWSTTGMEGDPFRPAIELTLNVGAEARHSADRAWEALLSRVSVVNGSEPRS